MTMKIDKIDRRILKELQKDSGRSMSDVADAVGLSQSPCWRRIDRMQREGIIEKQVSLLSTKALGFNAHLFVQVKLNAHGRQHLDEFSAAMEDLDEVLECWVLMGTADFMLRVVTRDMESYERLFFDKLSKVPGVQEINSTMALSRIKSTTALPLDVLR